MRRTGARRGRGAGSASRSSSGHIVPARSRIQRGASPTSHRSSCELGRGESHPHSRVSEFVALIAEIEFEILSGVGFLLTIAERAIERMLGFQFLAGFSISRSGMIGWRRSCCGCSSCSGGRLELGRELPAGRGRDSSRAPRCGVRSGGRGALARGRAGRIVRGLRISLDGLGGGSARFCGKRIRVEHMAASRTLEGRRVVGQHPLVDPIAGMTTRALNFDHRPSSQPAQEIIIRERIAHLRSVAPMRIALLTRRFDSAGGGTERDLIVTANACARRGIRSRFSPMRSAARRRLENRPRRRRPRLSRALSLMRFAYAAAPAARRAGNDLVLSFARCVGADILRSGGGAHVSYLRAARKWRGALGATRCGSARIIRCRCSLSARATGTPASSARSRCRIWSETI